MLKKGVKQMNDFKEELKSIKDIDRSSFMWNFIEGQLKGQSLGNLLDFRKMLNKIIAQKFREQDNKDKVGCDDK